jgi:hypothetical protein
MHISAGASRANYARSEKPRAAFLGVLDFLAVDFIAIQIASQCITALLHYSPDKYTEAARHPKGDRMASEINERAVDDAGGKDAAGGGVSGKLVIIAIFVAAVSAAAASWLFRYNATHRAAEFWGPEAAQLIRDAPDVKLFKEPTAPTDSLGVDLSNTDAIGAAIEDRINKSAVDVSRAPGLLHLRNALLDDSSFVWPPGEVNPSSDTTEIGYWWLSFSDGKSGKSTTIWFSEDCRQALQLMPKPNRPGEFVSTPISTKPISAGLQKVFAEMSTAQPHTPTAPSQ